MFENAEIAVDNLPVASGLDWQPLDARYTRRLQAQALLTAAVAAAALVVLRMLPLDAGFPLAPGWLAVAAGTVWGIVWPAVSVPRKAYAIREHDLLYRAGVVWRAESAVPFNRVQHVETTSTPLDRAFGLAALHLYTAGGAGGDLRIHGLPAGVAERLRLFVLERAGKRIER